MTITEKVKKKVLQLLSAEHLPDNPNDDRYTFLGDEDTIKQRRIQEYKVWYDGDSDELLNFYTAMDTYGNAKNPIYNRNKRDYFWGLSAEECNIKRIHSGVPQAIINTLVSLIGDPVIKVNGYDDKLMSIMDKTNLKNIINQKQMPLTLALGWGAFKPVIDKGVCKDSPLLEWYNADDVDFVFKHGICVGIIYKDYYKYNNKDYVLLETRRVANGNSYIEYKLYELGKNNEVYATPLATLPDLADINEEGIVIEGLDMLLGVPSIYFNDITGTGYGRSILQGKVDLLDDLDQDLSQASQTSRVSTPVEYIPNDLLGRGNNGEPKLPKIYNRQFLSSGGYPNGDGEMEGKITTSQPQVNFNQYNDKELATLNMILTGVLSPASLGLNLSRDDNALAQREKEKITILTRNNVIDRQTKIWKDIITQLLMLQEYMETNAITIREYEISIKYDEFASPTFETMASSLLPVYQAGAMSEEMFIDKLYGDSLSEEEKQREIEAIKNKQQQDQLEMGDFDNAIGQFGEDLQPEATEQEATDKFEG